MSIEITVSELYDLKETIAAGLLEGLTYPWEALPKIHDFIIDLGQRAPDAGVSQARPHRVGGSVKLEPLHGNGAAEGVDFGGVGRTAAVDRPGPGLEVFHLQVHPHPDSREGVDLERHLQQGVDLVAVADERVCGAELYDPGRKSSAYFFP